MAGNWPLRPLGELSDNFDSLRIPVKEAERRAGPYPYYGASGIVDHVDNFLFEGLYLLVAEDGENLRTKKTPIAFLANGRFWVNNHAHIIRGNEHADTRFLSYALQTIDISGFLTGSTIPKLTQDNLRRLPVPTPPVHEQRAIVDVLGALDDKIELNRRMNETLETMARALFKSWFIDFEPVRARMAGRVSIGMDALTAALFPKQLENGIPKGWSNHSLAAVVAIGEGEIQTGPFGSQLHASDYVDQGIPVVMPTNIRDRRIDTNEIARIGPTDANRLCRHQLHVGDLVYSRRGDVEKHAIVGPEEAGWLCGTGCLRVRPSAERGTGISHHFLSLWLDQTTTREWIGARAVGATMPNLNTKILGDVPVLLPTREVLDALDRTVGPLDARIRLARAESGSLAELRDMLLSRLLSGELRVRDAEREVGKVA